jgi:hypothetical protein
VGRFEAGPQALIFVVPDAHSRAALSLLENSQKSGKGGQTRTFQLTAGQASERPFFTVLPDSGFASI